jgi:hypothetical protein
MGGFYTDLYPPKDIERHFLLYEGGSKMKFQGAVIKE